MNDISKVVITEMDREMGREWWITIETKKGKRYTGIYDPITEEMVMEDFAENRNNFDHIN